MHVFKNSRYLLSKYMFNLSHASMVKDIYYCPIEIIKGLTDKGQFQYLTQLKGPQGRTYLYTIFFTEITIDILS